MQALDWGAVAPPVLLVAGIALLLLLDAAAPGGSRRRPDAVAVLSVLGAGAAVLALRGDTRGTLCVPADRTGAAACGYQVSGLSLGLQVLVLGAALGCLLLAVDAPGARVEHHVLLLSATFGAMLLAAARDLASIAVALELASLPAVGLVALRRDAAGAQAAVKLLMTSLLSFSIAMLGVALLYAATGSVHLTRVAAALSSPASSATTAGPAVTGAAPGLALAALGAAFLVAGLGFKLSAVPFHLWTPDTYAGAPASVAAFLAVVSKVAAVTALVVVLGVGLPSAAALWAPALGLLAVLSMSVGNLVALRQRSAVRLLAWSTVAQAGWVLLPLAAASGSTAGHRAAGGLTGAVQASVGYLVAYAAATLTAFSVVVLVSRNEPDGERHGLAVYRGLARAHPVAASALGFALACLAGLPPGVMGLLAKLVAVRPVVGAGAWVLAVAAAVNVVLALGYYLPWVARLFATPAPQARAATSWRVRPAEGVVLYGSLAACVVLSVLPGGLLAVVPARLR